MLLSILSYNIYEKYINDYINGRNAIKQDIYIYMYAHSRKQQNFAAKPHINLRNILLPYYIASSRKWGRQITGPIPLDLASNTIPITVFDHFLLYVLLHVAYWHRIKFTKITKHNYVRLTHKNSRTLCSLCKVTADLLSIFSNMGLHAMVSFHISLRLIHFLTTQIYYNYFELGTVFTKPNLES